MSSQTLLKKGNDTKTALIRSGMELMTTYGYLSSNIESILKQVGVPKGSFYYYFKSKADFGHAIITSYNNFFMHKLDKHLTNNAISSPLARIQAFYEDAKQGMAKYDYNRGCLIGELIQEESLLPKGYAKVLEQILLNWQAKLEECLLLAQQCGELKSNSDCKALAEFFWIGWEGAVTRSKLIKRSDPLDCFIQLFLDKIVH
ncbi:hypothetical protein A9G09_08970 [Gilliamella sp. wkB292]|uniref:acrylate utilization transcriptional regulator AcuR n=1 Tax=unclassified Gilliamella TaxID=2685620 RepID=UPI00080E7724|nr:MULTISPECIES: TetR/AcrR family transcriptional regulator [Gilliamella]MCX8729502.1 TetR/AcrR family transcriptional regulator [Gilliamella sp. B2969]OCG12892.1 hypothetical protein A9G09_08970 [Gilliamella apicola]